MRVLTPTVSPEEASSLAARPSSLDGKVVGFLDGWGLRKDDGTFDKYPLMESIKKYLEENYDIKEFIWMKKPNIAQDAPEEMLSELVDRADVVVNGECL